MFDEGRSAAAIQQFNGKDVGGRALNVNEAKPRRRFAAAVAAVATAARVTN